MCNPREWQQCVDEVAKRYGYSTKCCHIGLASLYKSNILVGFLHIDYRRNTVTRVEVEVECPEPLEIFRLAIEVEERLRALKNRKE